MLSAYITCITDGVDKNTSEFETNGKHDDGEILNNARRTYLLFNDSSLDLAAILDDPELLLTKVNGVINGLKAESLNQINNFEDKETGQSSPDSSKIPDKASSQFIEGASNQNECDPTQSSFFWSWWIAVVVFVVFAASYMIYQ